MVPMGLGHDQNIYDILRHRTFTMMQQQTMQHAAIMDRENFLRTYRGFTAMAGLPYDIRMRRHAGVFADVMQQIAPIGAMLAPEAMDVLGGAAGSNVVMAQQMMMADRYRMDPVTGRLGMPHHFTTMLANQTFQQMFSRENIGRMYGLSAGQAGSLYNQLVQRGLVGMEPGTLRERTERVLGMLSPEEVRQALDRTRRAGYDIQAPVGPQLPGRSGFSGTDIDRLALDPEIGGRIRSLDIGRTTRALQSYSRAVAAIRDIFGDMGRPNAPMAELMQGLEMLTMGSMAQMDPGRMAQIARQTYSLARTTGVPLQTAMMIQQHAGARAMALGLEPSFAIQATQGGLAFGGAYRGSGMAAHTAWGMMSADQLQQADVNLRVGAAASSQANRLAVAMRLSQAHGGFQPGSEAAAMISAIEGGYTTFAGQGGRMMPLGMDQREFYRILTSARGRGGRALGISENDVREMLGQQFDNRELIDRHNLGNLVRNMQGGQVSAFIGARFGETLISRFVGAGVDRQEAMRIMAARMPGIMEAIGGISREDFSNAATRNQLIGGILQEQLQGTAAAQALQSMSPAQRATFLQQTATLGYGRVNTALGSSGFRGLGNWQNVHVLTNPALLRQADAGQLRSRLESGLAEALSPLGQGTMLRRAFAALQGAPADANFASVVAQALGGVRPEDINTALVQPMQGMNQQIIELQALHNRVMAMPPGPARAALEAEVRSRQQTIQNAAAGVAATARTHGFFGEGSIRASDTAQALSANRAAARSMQDMAALVGNFGRDVTPADRTAALSRARWGQMTQQEVAAMIIAGREARIRGLTVDSPEVLQNAAALMRRYPLLSPDAARSQALQEIRSFNLDRNQQTGLRVIDQVTPQDITATFGQMVAQTHPMFGNTPEAIAMQNALVLAQRASAPMDPTEDQVTAYVIGHGGTRAAARENLVQEMRANRFGISSTEIDVMVASGGAGNRQEAIARIIESRHAEFFNITPRQRQLAREQNAGLVGASDSQVDAYIMTERHAVVRRNYDAFLRTPAGRVFSENIEDTINANQMMQERLVGNRDVIGRLGTRAVDYHTRLRDIAMRRQVLAGRYAGGNIRDLLGGVFVAPDARTAARIRSEIAQLQLAEREIFEEIHGTHGFSGRQYRVANQAAAIASLQARGEDPSPENIRAEQLRLGNVGEAARLLRISPAEEQRLLGTPLQNLSPADRSRRLQLELRVGDVEIARGLAPDEEAVIRSANGQITTALSNLAIRKQVSPQTLLRVMRDVLDPQQTLASEFRRQMAVSGTELAGSMAQAFGISNTPGDRRMEELATALGMSSQSRAMGHHLIWSQRQISSAAASMAGGQGALIRHYRGAMAMADPGRRQMALEGLQSAVGINMQTAEGRRRWEDLSEALATQQQFGLLEGREGGGGLSSARLHAAFTQMAQRFDRIPSQGPGGGLPGNHQYLTGTIDVTLRTPTQGTGDVNFRTSSSPTNVSAP
jgi:hypothetical protein